MTNNSFRTHHAGALRADHVDQSVLLSGWVHRHRHHGALIFFDLRDGSGLVQITCDPALSQSAHEIAAGLHSEYVVRVAGRVRRRPDANPNLATGEIEVLADSIEILNRCATLPFQVDTEGDAPRPGEELRLAYRYLDLRKPEMRELLVVRHRAVQAIRESLNSAEFFEIETPILMKSTPEGARDFLVPSRVNTGTFYALPQSPQLYKQILMVAGMERYYQIAKCFRDEDMRADRQPEFTQLDLEMSFVSQEDVFQVTEACIAAAVETTRGIKIETPFPRLTYAESMERYGTDKPDIRFGLELARISDLAADSGFGVFRNAVAAGGVVKALRIPDGANRSRKAIGELEKVAKVYGAKGLAWFKLNAGQATGGIAKFLTGAEVTEITARTMAVDGDAVVFVADTEATANAALGNLRNQVGQELGLTSRDKLCFVWIVDFPLFEETEDGWAPLHHMFTLPNLADLENLETSPGSAHAQLYDLVLNGWELGSGSIRCHDAEIQRRIMRIVGMSEEEAERRFGFLLKALDYGAPPHGGIALGIDRLVTLLAPHECNMRDVIAFPKTLSGVSLMDGCPAPVDPEQLEELGIAIVRRQE